MHAPLLQGVNGKSQRATRPDPGWRPVVTRRRSATLTLPEKPPITYGPPTRVGSWRGDERVLYTDSTTSDTSSDTMPIGRYSCRAS
jgi:hypothetical protein